MQHRSLLLLLCVFQWHPETPTEGRTPLQCTNTSRTISCPKLTFLIGKLNDRQQIPKREYHSSLDSLSVFYLLDKLQLSGIHVYVCFVFMYCTKYTVLEVQPGHGSDFHRHCHSPSTPLHVHICLKTAVVPHWPSLLCCFSLSRFPEWDVAPCRQDTAQAMCSWEMLLPCHCRDQSKCVLCSHSLISPGSRGWAYGLASSNGFSNLLTGTWHLPQPSRCGRRHLLPRLLQYLTTDKMVWCCTRSSGFHSFLIFALLQILVKAGTALADNLRTGILKFQMNPSREGCHLYSRVRSARWFLQLKEFLPIRKSWLLLWAGRWLASDSNSQNSSSWRGDKAFLKILGEWKIFHLPASIHSQH